MPPATSPARDSPRYLGLSGPYHSMALATTAVACTQEEGTEERGEQVSDRGEICRGSVQRTRTRDTGDAYAAHMRGLALQQGQGGREGRQGRASLTRWGLAAWKVLTEDLERRRDILCVLGLA